MRRSLAALDVHLMVGIPLRFPRGFEKAGADISFDALETVEDRSAAAEIRAPGSGRALDKPGRRSAYLRRSRVHLALV